ncbi:hypothetical protein ACVW0J_001820 [Bradyrhizobium sp. i1.7.7]
MRASASAVGQVFDALLRPEVKLHPGPLVGGIDEAVGMAAEAMHVPEASGKAALAHHDGDLVQSLRQQRPEIPIVVGAAHSGSGIALDRMIEVGKAQGIAEEEHGRVVAHHVPIAFLGVELQRKAADVAFGVGCAALAGHRRDAREHRRDLADLREDPGLAVAGDVMGDREGPEGAGSLGVHASLGNHLAIEVSQLLDQPDILQQCGPAAARGHDVEVIADGRARRMGQTFRLIGHGMLLNMGSLAIAARVRNLRLAWVHSSRFRDRTVLARTPVSRANASCG